MGFVSTYKIIQRLTVEIFHEIFVHVLGIFDDRYVSSLTVVVDRSVRQPLVGDVLRRRCLLVVGFQDETTRRNGRREGQQGVCRAVVVDEGRQTEGVHLQQIADSVIRISRVRSDIADDDTVGSACARQCVFTMTCRLTDIFFGIWKFSRYLKTRKIY